MPSSLAVTILVSTSVGCVYDINEWCYFDKMDNHEMFGKILANSIYLRSIQYDRFVLKPNSCQV